MIRVFMSYRRNDASEIAERMYEYLVDAFGADYVFWDRNAAFKDLNQLRSFVRDADILLVLIGAEWLNILEERQTRPNEEDWVLEEIAVGLTTDGVLVIPISVNNATHPPTSVLPDRIKSLAHKIGNSITDQDDEAFRTGMATLVRRIKMRQDRRYGGVSAVFPELPDELLRKSIRNARNIIRIMCIWSSRWAGLDTAIKTSLSQGARLEILLLNPDNSCTRQRDIDLGRDDGYTARKIKSNIDDLAGLVRSSDFPEDRVTVKLYNALPSRVLYFADELVLIGSHPIMQLSSNAPYVVAFGNETNLYANVWDHFENLWNAGPPHTRVIDLLNDPQ